jgi:hypothetical protein
VGGGSREEGIGQQDDAGRGRDGDAAKKTEEREQRTEDRIADCGFENK